MKYNVGQEVKFVNSVGSGRVERIEDGVYYVADDTGFSYPFAEEELVQVGELQVGEVWNKESVSLKATEPAHQQVDRLIIDLHSHELIETTHGMTRYDILNLQLTKAKETLAEARRRRIPKVLIIHGKGTGRLRDEIQNLLSKMGGIEYYYADFADGGYGATEIRFRSNS